jgi:hypothetical protein
VYFNLCIFSKDFELTVACNNNNNNNNNVCLLIDAAIPSDRNVILKESENKLKLKKNKYRNSANVEHEMFHHTGNHWSYRNCNSRTQKISGYNTRKAFNRFSTKNSCTRNITHYKESATIRNLKPEW